MELNTLSVRKTLENALLEDIGDGDLTSRLVFPDDVTVSAEIIFRSAGIAAGMGLITILYSLLDPPAEVELLISEGKSVGAGQRVAVVSGSARTVLAGERITLNFLQRLGAIATKTRQFVDAVDGTNAKILDTRKTTPGLRLLEKYAVTVGGGVNHRFGLFDGILIKDNHIAAVGGINPAVTAVRKRIGPGKKIEVEAETLVQVEEALDSGADIILLDNMDLERLREAVSMIRGRALTEASGGITLQTVAQIARTGVDFISVGEITHSPGALDISMEVDAGK